MQDTRVNTESSCVTSKQTGILSYLNSSLYRYKIGELLVRHGYITPYELKYALKIQQKTDKPLGQIALELNLVSKFQLMSMLGSQKALRLAAASLLYVCSFGFVAKKSHAETINDVPARITLASVNTNAFKSVKAYPSLFGATEKKSKNLKAFTKWSGMFDRFEKELNKPSANKIITDLKAELASYKSDSIHAMAKDVNAMMNKQKYIVDNKNWGQSDYWATPIEFLTRGGDCEDFAIAKYVALRALGVPENRLRIAIVQDKKKNIPHAILIVYTEQGAHILDNQIKTVKHVNTVAHYKPIFSINREAWWLHTTPKAPNTIVASAR